MSKKTKNAGPNKSEAIRTYKAANPTAAPKEIAAELAKQSIVVSAQFVSTVLSNAKKNGGKVGKRGPKPGGKAGKALAAFDIQALVAFQKAVKAYGGFGAAREAINTLEKLGVN